MRKLNMNVGVSVDGTWTTDPALFEAMYWMIRGHGHNMIIVSGKEQPTEKLLRLGVPLHARFICSNGKLKEEACRESGIEIDWWIDNEPGTIQRCKILDTST